MRVHWLRWLAHSVDWVRDFYSTTGTWWAAASARITEQDRRRVSSVHSHTSSDPKRILELGAGWCVTAGALAQAGHDVTAIEISDRADSAGPFIRDAAPGRLSVIKDDFYAVQLSDQFDVVCYWNGFGVGTDDDQRRLLKRIADEWLEPHGVALIDVFNPFVWASWHGDEEHLMPRPELGYDYELHERTTFDQVTCTASDIWWPAGEPEKKITQHLRCYTPADLSLLLEGTGLALEKIDVDDPLNERHEYLAILTRTTP